MTVTRVDKDFDTLTLTLTAEFDASVERVWELLADPRKLERWWGPPDCPATVYEHDFSAGGAVTYSMALPDGGTSRGWWRVTAIDPPTWVEFTDGWADEDGTPNPAKPTTDVRIRLFERDGGTRMEMRSAFGSQEHLEQVLRLGGVEGLQQAVGQMDALLAG
jgi:uncharacterized protein YndB with AHSA1/START domain